MRILLHKEINDDLKLCRKKKWYNGIAEEMPGLYKLLRIDKQLPGQAPIHNHLGQKWGGKIFHARIALPKESCGGRNGGRVVYTFTDDDACVVLYVGGHKDKRYDDPRSIARILLERVEDKPFLEWVFTSV